MNMTSMRSNKRSKPSPVVGFSPLTQVDAVSMRTSARICAAMRAQVQENCIKLMRMWSLVPIQTPARSYAQVAGVRSSPQRFVPVITQKQIAIERQEADLSASKKVLTAVRLPAAISRKEARADFARFNSARNAERQRNNKLAYCIAQRYKCHYDAVVTRTKERQANNLLIAAITARYSKVVPEPRAPFRISTSAARADYTRCNRLRAMQRKHNNHLAACISFRYGLQYDARVHSMRAAWYQPEEVIEEGPKRGPCTRKKQPKLKKVAVKEDWDAILKGLKRKDFPGLKRKPEKVNVQSVLQSTVCGRHLFAGLMRVVLKRRELLSDFEQIVSSVVVPPSLEEVPVGQMDVQKPEQDLGQENISQRSTAVIETGADTTSVLPHETGYYYEASSVDQQEYATFSERWIRLSNITWATSDVQGSRLSGSIQLPYSAIRNNFSSQNAALFLQHKFFRSGCTLKIVCNSTRWHVGQVVASVFYSEGTSKSYGQNNYVSALQRLHLKIPAGTDFTGELKIPYHYPNASMAITDGSDFCIVEFYVMNPLAVTDQASKSITFSVFLAFDDAVFNGMIARILRFGDEERISESDWELTGQMNPIQEVAKLALDPSISGAINVASTVLNTLGSDANRDNPPLPLQPVSFIPQGLGSFCNVDNVLAPVNVLRADAVGQVPYREVGNEMNTDQLRDTWGLLSQFEWNISDAENQELWYKEVAPTLPLSRYVYGVPTPLAMLGSINGFWRGDIEFKFEIVANAFYQAKFMVTGVPLASSSIRPKLSQAQYSANAVFSLSDSDEKCFTFPWNWRNAFARTRSHQVAFDSIGLIQVFVINPIVAISGVPQKIYVNVYTRGGRNFEHAIIRPPILYSGLNDSINPPETQSPTAYNLESEWFTGWVGACKSKDGKYPLVPLISNVSKGWVGYTHLRAGYVYKLTGFTLKGKAFRCGFFVAGTGNQKRIKYIKYGTYDVALSTANAHGMIVSDVEKDLRDYVKAIKDGKSVEEARDKLNNFWIQDGNYSEIQNGNGAWIPATDPADPPIWQWAESNVAEPQMKRAVRFSKPTKLTNRGMTVFGEASPDLKSYCRRYNLLDSIVIPACTAGLSQDCKYSAIMRVFPIRDITIAGSATFNNRYLEGPISAIGEMYRFWKGGMRYRFVVTGNPPEGTQIFVSHRYDVYSPSMKPIIINPNKGVVDRNDMLHTQYASYCHPLSVNQAFSIEVPYYQEKEYLSTLSTTDKNWTDNGSLLIWITSKVPADINLEVYYAFADDTRFKLFQGVGICKDITNIAPEPQMDSNGQLLSQRYWEDRKDPFYNEPQVRMRRNWTPYPHPPDSVLLPDLPRPPQPSSSNTNPFESTVWGQGGFISKLKSKVNYVRAKCTRTKDDLMEATEAVADLAGNLKGFTEKAQAMSATMKYVTQVWDFITENGGKVFDIAVNVFYALTAHSFLHAVPALVSILRRILPTVKNITSELTRRLTKMAESMVSEQPPQVPSAQGFQDWSEEQIDAVSSLGTFIFSALSTICGVVATPPKSFKAVKAGLFDFASVARSARSVKTYFTDTIEFVKRCSQLFTAGFSVTSDDYKVLSGLDDSRLQAWLVDSLYFTNTSNREAITSSPTLAVKVFELELVGRAFMVATVTNNSPPKLSSMIQKVAKDLMSLVEELKAKKVFSSVRYEPALIWVGGKAGVGKSRFVLRLMEEWAKRKGITMPNYYFPYGLGSKHMDMMQGKPFVYVDDAGALSFSLDPNLLALMLQGKSPSQYAPIFAALELKGSMAEFTDMWITSNLLYWGNDPAIISADALNRRRTIVVDMGFRDNYTPERVSKMKPEELDKLQHAKVDILNNLDPNRRTPIPRPNSANNTTGEDDYGVIVQNRIFDILEAYHENETVRYIKACKMMTERIEAFQKETTLTFEENLSKFRELVTGLSHEGRQTPDLTSWMEECKKEASYNPVLTHPKVEIPVIEADEESDSDIPDVPEAQMGKPGKLNTCIHLGMDLNEVTYSREDTCWMSVKSVRLWPYNCTSDECPYHTPTDLMTMAFLTNEYNKDDYNEFLETEPEKRNIMQFPDSMHPFLMKRLCMKKQDYTPSQVEALIRSAVEKEQKKWQEKNEVVAEQVVPVKHPTIPQKIWSGIKLFLTIVCNLLTWTLVIFLAISTVKIISKIFSPSAQLHPSGDYQTLKSGHSVKHKAMRLVRPEMAQRESMVEVQDQFQEKINIILKNFVYIHGTNPETKEVYKGRCLGLYGREVLIVKHYIDHFVNKGIKRVTIVRPNADATIFEVDMEDLLFAWGDCGYGVMTLPSSYPTQFRKITQFFPSEDLNTEYPASIRILEGKNSVLYDMQMVVVDSVHIPKNGTFDEWTIHDGFKYPWGGSGRCGSLILSPTLAAPIIGIHTAGIGQRIGYAERLYRESFEEPQDLVDYVVPQLDVDGPIYQLDGSYTEVGRLPAELVPNFPKQTAIVPSVIAPVFPVTTQPAPLSNDDIRLEEYADILKIGTSKRCDPIKEFPRDVVEIAVEGYKHDILHHVKPLRGNIGMLSPAQAIEGLACDNTGPIVMSTSEGFPWRSMRPKNENSKRWLFKLENTPEGLKVLGIWRELYETLQYKHEMRLNNRVPASYFTACLKDARINLSKVHIPGKTRIFEMSPIDLTIAQRQYCYDFVGAYMASRFEHAIGIAPDGPEWSSLANSLSEFSPYIITADYSSYGPRLNSELLYRAFGITSAWYRFHMEQQGREDSELIKVQNVLAHEVAHGLHVVKDLVFRPSSGLPSGNIETVTKNSQVNSLYVRIAYLILARENAPHFADLYWFKAFVLLYTYGDDLIMAVKEEIIGWFNNETIIKFFARYRLTMTDALKSGVVRRFCTLEEATFLKRGFLRHPTRSGEWLAPLERASITDTANWIHRSINPLDASLVNSEMSCRLAYTLGPKEFNKICSTIKTAWLHYGVCFDFPSWESLDAHVWDNTLGPKFSF